MDSDISLGGEAPHPGTFGVFLASGVPSLGRGNDYSGLGAQGPWNRCLRRTRPGGSDRAAGPKGNRFPPGSLVEQET